MISDYIASMAQLVTALMLVVNFIQSYRNGMKSKALVEKVTLLEQNTNSKMDSLLAVTAKASLAEGTAVGLQQGRDELRSEEPIKVEVTQIPPPTKA